MSRRPDEQKERHSQRLQISNFLYQIHLGRFLKTLCQKLAKGDQGGGYFPLNGSIPRLERCKNVWGEEEERNIDWVGPVQM